MPAAAPNPSACSQISSGKCGRAGAPGAARAWVSRRCWTSCSVRATPSLQRITPGGEACNHNRKQKSLGGHGGTGVPRGARLCQHAPWMLRRRWVPGAPWLPGKAVMQPAARQACEADLLPACAARRAWPTPSVQTRKRCHFAPPVFGVRCIDLKTRAWRE